MADGYALVLLVIALRHALADLEARAAALAEAGYRPV